MQKFIRLKSLLLKNMNNKIINVIPATKISVAKNQIFSYFVPPGFSGKLNPGQEVSIKLRNRLVRGVIDSIPNEINEDIIAHLKPAESITSEHRVLNDAQLNLAKWIANYYHSSLVLVIKAMIPPTMSNIIKWMIVISNLFLMKMMIMNMEVGTINT